MAFTPTDPTKAEVRTVQTGTQLEFDFYIPRGAKGEPGGLTTGTLLGSANLNDITVPGMYRTSSSVGTTYLNNYPVNNNGGILMVTEMAPGYVVQTYEAMNGTSNSGSVMYKRQRANGNWTGWKAYTSQWVDNTAGRAIYTWDDVNSREQLTYGDTGWRDVSADANAAVGGATPVLRIRRAGQVVSFVMDAKPVTGGSDTPVYTLPGGFRFLSNSRFGTAVDLAGSNTRLVTSDAAGSLVTVRSMPFFIMYGSFSFFTSDSWPTALPGTPVGGIPNL